MQTLTPAGTNLVNDLSNRYGLSYEAVLHMLIAVNNGGGTMAQFNSPELGGGGQWMRGGMTMVGDMFNGGLKNTVNNLCSELSDALANTEVFPVIPAGTPGSNQWWPGDLGSPSSSGGQNNTRYAVFQNRLAIETNGEVTVYDTLDHNIGGVSQQQGNDMSLTFSSQYGTVSVNQLPVISGKMNNSNPPQNNFVSQEPVMEPAFNQEPQSEPFIDNQNVQADLSSADDIIELISKLATLRDSGAISEQDYNTKKQELLARI